MNNKCSQQKTKTKKTKVEAGRPLLSTWSLDRSENVSALLSAKRYSTLKRKQMQMLDFGLYVHLALTAEAEIGREKKEYG